MFEIYLNKLLKSATSIAMPVLSLIGIKPKEDADTSQGLMNGSIHKYAQEGNLNSLRMLLSDPSINFDTPDQEGNTPLFKAMSCANFEVVSFLLDHQCRINFQNTHGQSPLFEAVHTNSMDFMSKVLALETIDVTITDENGSNVMHTACMNGLVNSVVVLASTHPHLVNESDKYGKTPLMYSAENAYVNILKLLLTEKTQINASCNDGWTALMYATSKGALDIMSLLIAHGADLESRDNSFQQTPFLIAVKSGHLEAAELLKKHDAKFDVTDYYDRTALHLAVETNNEEMVKCVLSTHIQVGAKDKFGLTAREWAVVNAPAEILKRIITAEKERH